MEQYRQTKAYYSSIRRPGLERATFVLALVASGAVCLRVFGVGFSNGNHHTQWLTAFYWGSFVFFAGLDSFLSKAHHPVPTPFGSLNPARIYEKFAMRSARGN
jgi:protein-S-isoprenylcysteine O-methyltransferase Ste14